jgi:hypothetical protein
MGEPITWIGIAGLVVSNIAIWIDKIAGARRRNGKNGTNKKLCEDHTTKLDDHSTAIAELKTHRQNTDDKIDLMRKENRIDHAKIFDRISDIAGK